MAKEQGAPQPAQEHQQGAHQNRKIKTDTNYCRVLTQMFTGVPDRTFRDLFNRMFIKWGQPTPHDITANKEHMKALWDPNKTDIIKQINGGNLFAYFVRHHKNNNDLVTVGKKIILDTGLFATQYGQWRQLNANDHTWAHFDEFWTRQLDLWHKTTCMASQHGYGGNISSSQTTKDEFGHEAQAYYNSLRKFGDANGDNAATFHSLSQANQHMANNITTDVKALQQQMAQILIAMNNLATMNSPSPPMYPTHTPAYGYAATQNYPPQQQNNQAYQTSSPQLGNRGSQPTGHGRGGGHQCGRGRTYQHTGYNNSYGQHKGPHNTGNAGYGS